MSGYEKIRELCAEARADDAKATPVPWKYFQFTQLYPDGSVGPRSMDDVVWISGARAREPRLARLLEAALEVVEATEHLGYDITGPDPVAVMDKVGRAISRFRSLAEQEGGDQP